MAIKFLNTVAVDTDVLYVDASNDRVGIGTTSPETNLQIGEGTGTQRILLYGANSLSTSSEIILADSSSGPAVYRFGAGIRFDSSNNILSLRSFFNGNNTQDVSLIDLYRNTATENTPIRINYDTSFSGNVGIGTTSPSVQLDIEDSSNVLIDINTTTANANTTIRFQESGSNTATIGYDGTNDGLILTTGGFTAGNGIFIDNNQNVGIGTTSPIYPLQVAGNTYINNGTLFIDSGRRIKWGNSNQWIEGTNDTSLEFSGGGGGTQMILTSTGNVGIGTTSPSRKLEVDFTSTVYGAKFTRSDAAGSSLIEFANSAGVKSIIGYDAGVDGYKIGTASATNLVVKQNGNVGIGTTSPLRKLSVFGNSIVSSEFKGSSAGHLIDISNSNVSPTYNGIRFQHDTTFKMAVTHIADGTTKGYIQIGNGYATGSEILVVDGRNSNVGIGTTSPSAKLQISTTMTSSPTSNIFLDVDGTNTTGGGGSIIFGTSASAGSTTSYNAKITGIRVAGGNGGDSQLGFWTTLVSDSVNPQERMTITKEGNVGIGTTSPTEKLEVSGNILIDSIGQELQFSNHSVGAYRDGSNRLMISGYGGIRFQAEAVGGMENQATRMVINPSGNVGIGVNSPSSKLHVNSGAENTVALFESADARSRIVLKDNSGEGQLNALGDNITFATSSSATERMRITSSGNVGIGTTSPNKKLEVAGNVKLDGDNRHIYFGGNNTFIGERSNSTELELRGGGNSSAQTVYIDNTGNLGIGTSNPVQKLHVTGNARVTGAYYDSNNLPGTSGQVLSSTATGTDWVSLSEISGVDGTGTTNYLAKWSDSDTITDSVIYDNGTNVGIGTTSPAARLEVKGDDTINALKVTDSDGGDGLKVTSHTTQGTYIQAYDASHTQTIMLDARTDNNLRHSYFNGGGNVGIGTTSPNAALQINGGTSNNSNRSNVALFTGNNAGGLVDALGLINGATATFGNAVALNFHNASSYSPTGAIRVYQVSSGTITDASMRFYTYQGGLTEKMRITPAGNIGIGTDSPVNKLNVNGDIGYIGVIGQGSIYGNTGNSSYANMQLYNPSTGYSTFNNQSYGYYFQTAGSTKVTILNNGDVGIGTTSPNYKLEVNGGARAGGVVTYSKNYGSLNTTGNAVAGLTTGFNGASAGFTFTCFGHGGYQKVVYSCYNVSGTWNTIKVIDEGTNAFDVEASANATTITFTFKTVTGTKSYTPRVTVEATGTSINSTYA